MATLYCAPADIKNALGGTDSGTGTAAQLSDAQLTQAITRASNRVSAYAGTVYDSSTAQLLPPPMVVDLTLDLANFYATATYLKGKAISADDPVRVAYNAAIQVLNDIRDGKVRIDPTAGQGVTEGGRVVNTIPSIFTGADSNTRSDGRGGIVPDTTPDNRRTGWFEDSNAW